MRTATRAAPRARPPAPATTPSDDGRGLYTVGGGAALLSVALIPIQLVIFALWPPPDTAPGFFALFAESWLLGLLSLDLLYMPQNVLLALIYLALFVPLRRASPSAMAIALLLGSIGIAAYFASPPAFEMLALSRGYAAATTDAGRAALLAAGEALLATYKGTAFIVYYLLNAIALLIIGLVMLRGGGFSRATAYAGLIAAGFMAVPSTFGTLGMIFALASLAPWSVFCVLVGRRLLQLGRAP
ncbi:MAG: DUF4386 family protein [Anaerolineales bacterium]|nr:DUF4386 family protein [Anaerolineales bacterium]